MLTFALQPICAGGWFSLPVGSIVSASPPATGGRRDDAVEAGTARPHPRCRAGGLHGKQAASPANGAANPFVRRSEEHTSELQSLMRISYAVFCLIIKKKSTERDKIRLHQ